ncbi:MAG TPA: hypothetical protein VLA72_00020 [Anaerolineales bacterium]|nr:hypothetical protein [Anaerolineales bacterium]
MNKINYPKEYPTSTYWVQLLLWILACFAVAWNVYKIGSVLIRKPEFWFLAVFQILVQFYMLVFMYHVVQDFRLTLSNDGLKLSIWSLTIYVNWNQVIRLDYAFFQKQLVIENPVIERRKAWWLWLDFHKLRRDDSFRMIPFSKLTWEKFSEIEAEVKKQKPGIFGIVDGN